jgi:class 3 adenylate cyclase
MRVKESMLNNVIKGLSRSMTQKEMIHLVRRIVPDYDLHKRMGVYTHNAVAHGDGARQIVKDMREWNYFPDLVSLMAQAETQGIHGRKYHFPRLGHVIQLMAEDGIIYNRDTNSFIEDSRRSITKNWGVLREGETCTFAVLKLDLVKNTQMVRQNDPEVVEKTFDLIRRDINEIVHLRLGRIWSWEGDGAICAYYYGTRNEQAVYSAMEILHRLFLFNHFSNKLDRPVQLRLAIRSGPIEFSLEEGKIKMAETVKETYRLEEDHTDPDSLTISQEVFSHLPGDVSAGFRKLTLSGREQLYNYRLSWENHK